LAQTILSAFDDCSTVTACFKLLESFESLLERMEVDAAVDAIWGEASDDRDQRPLLINIRGGDLSLLIGRKGETLSALQYITRLIVGKETQRSITLVIDVQGYRGSSNVPPIIIGNTVLFVQRGDKEARYLPAERYWRRPGDQVKGARQQLQAGQQDADRIDRAMAVRGFRVEAHEVMPFLTVESGGYRLRSTHPMTRAIPARACAWLP
jgi:hypothetical protein